MLRRIRLVHHKIDVRILPYADAPTPADSPDSRSTESPAQPQAAQHLVQRQSPVRHSLARMHAGYCNAVHVAPKVGRESLH